MKTTGFTRAPRAPSSLKSSGGRPEQRDLLRGHRRLGSPAE